MARVWSVAVALQPKQSPVTRRCLQSQSLSPAGRPRKTPSPTPCSVAVSMPSIYIACSSSATRSVSSPSGCRQSPPFPRPKPPRPSPPAVARRPVSGRAAGTCRAVGRPPTAGLSDRTKTFASIKTAVRVTADNQMSLSRTPLSSGLHKTIADELSQQVNNSTASIN